MKIKRRVTVASFFLIVFLLVSCAPLAEKQCSSDRDCVPAQCCHPSDAVSREYAPDCRGILCTMECKPETMDCGQGEISCVEGECKAIISE